jgi:hypothetical protein
MPNSNNFFDRIIMTFLFFLSINFIGNGLQAQDPQKPKVNLTEQQWKAVEGIFQSSQNSEMNVQFTVKDNMLVAKLLWNNNQLQLSPESPLEFLGNAGEEGPVRIVFTKDSSGAINQVSVANNGIWKRNNNYKPLDKKVIDLSPEQLKPYEGLYQLQNDESQFVRFSVKDGHLTLRQEWDGGERSFVAESLTDFFIKDLPIFTLHFSIDKDGNPTQVLALKRDLWVKTKKPTITAEQMKAYEGEYRSKDDPDNLVKLFVANGHLVVQQLWDRKEIILDTKTDDYFSNDAKSYSVAILKNKENTDKQIMVLGTNVFTKIK